MTNCFNNKLLFYVFLVTWVVHSDGIDPLWVIATIVSDLKLVRLSDFCWVQFSVFRFLDDDSSKVEALLARTLRRLTSLKLVMFFKLLMFLKLLTLRVDRIWRWEVLRIWPAEYPSWLCRNFAELRISV